MTDLTQLSDAQLQALYSQSGQGGPPAVSQSATAPTPPSAYAETPLSADEAHGLMSQRGGPQPYVQTAEQSQAWEGDRNAKFAAPPSYIRQEPQTGAYFLRGPAPAASQAGPTDPAATQPPAQQTAPIDLSKMSDGDLLAAYRGQGSQSPSVPPPNTFGGGDPGAPVGPLQTFVRSTDATVRGLANGALFGLPNRAQAAIDAFPALVHGGLDAFGPQFSSNLTAQQQRDDADAREVPYATWPGRVLGTAATAAAMPQMQAPGLIGRAAIGAGQGALFGGLDALGNARGNIGEMSRSSWGGIGTGALLGGPFGAIFGARAPAASKLAAAASRADYSAAGIDPIPAVVGGKALQQVGQILAGNPITGGPLRKAAATSIDQGQRAAEQMAASYGSAATPFESGGALQRGGQLGVKAMKAAVGKIYGPIDPLLRSSATVPVTNTQAALKEVFSRYSSPGMQSWFRQNAPKLAQLNDVLSQSGGSTGVTFPELRALRSDLGSMLQDHTINTMDQAQLKRLYGSMTDDYYLAAQQLGGAKARTAVVRGDAYNAAMRQRISDALDTVLKANSPEQAYDRVKAMAGSTSRADLSQLQTLKRSIPSEAWGDFTAGVLRNLSKGNDGSFSFSSLATNWDRLSPEGRKILFGGNKSMANEQALGSLVKVAADTRAASKFYNASQSGNHLITALMLEEPVRAVFEGRFHDLPAVVSTGGLGYATARLLASPGFARIALMGAKTTTSQQLTDFSSRLGSYATENPGVAGEVKAFRANFMRRLATNAPATVPGRLISSTQSRQ